MSPFGHEDTDEEWAELDYFSLLFLLLQYMSSHFPHSQEGSPDPSPGIPIETSSVCRT